MGRGTTISLYFSLTDAPRTAAAIAPAEISSRLTGNETVLIVDDDEGVRKTLRRYLEKYGYQVIVAQDGDQAYELLSQTPNIALVVSDAVMPRMTGRQLFDLVSQQRPLLPFLFCSGFPAGTFSQEILAQPHRALLAKPFSEAALVAKVRHLLDGAAGATQGASG